MGDRTTARYCFPIGTMELLRSIDVDGWDEKESDEFEETITAYDCSYGHYEQLEVELIRRRIPFDQVNDKGGEYGAACRRYFFDRHDHLVIVEDYEMEPQDRIGIIGLVREGVDTERLLKALGDDPRRTEAPDLPTKLPESVSAIKSYIEQFVVRQRLMCSRNNRLKFD